MIWWDDIRWNIFTHIHTAHSLYRYLMGYHNIYHPSWFFGSPPVRSRYNTPWTIVPFPITPNVNPVTSQLGYPKSAINRIKIPVFFLLVKFTVSHMPIEKSAWNQHKNSMKSVWNQHEISMKSHEIPWNHHEITMKSHEIPWNPPFFPGELPNFCSVPEPPEHWALAPAPPGGSRPRSPVPSARCPRCESSRQPGWRWHPGCCCCSKVLAIWRFPARHGGTPSSLDGFCVRESPTKIRMMIWGYPDFRKPLYAPWCWYMLHGEIYGWLV